MTAVHKHEGKWYFWDEVWANRIGPYDSMIEAEIKMEEYFDHLNRKPEGR